MTINEMNNKIASIRKEMEAAQAKLKWFNEHGMQMSKEALTERRFVSRCLDDIKTVEYSIKLEEARLPEKKLVFVNGCIADKVFIGKHFFVNLKGKWFTKEKLESIGLPVIVRTARM